MNKLKKVKIYDNGGKTWDRYTAVYLDEPQNSFNIFAARAMSSKPFSPQGFGQYCTATPGRHLGKLVKFEDLPQDCQKLIMQDLAD